jgi:vacuolar-type H+-ATPase subunit F/Vma7
MFSPLFIGDPVSAAGFRLGGMSVSVPEPGSEASLFQEALKHNDLIIMTAEFASQLSQAVIKSVQIAGSPLLLVIPDVRQQHEAPDIAAELRRQLGMIEAPQ